MQRLPVESSDIVSIGYDPAEHLLEVEFQGGRLYHYRDVEPEVHAQFIRADSHGTFFFAHINGRYRYQKVGDPEAGAGGDQPLAFVGGDTEELQRLQVACEPYDIAVEPLDLPIDEIQSDEQEVVAVKKAKQAYRLARQPVVVSIMTWNILALHGFPGLYADAISRWLSVEDILKLLAGKSDRTVLVVRIAAFYDGKRHKLFKQDYWGVIGEQPCGKGSSLEQLVILAGQDQTMAEQRGQGRPALTAPEETIWQELAKWLRLQRRLRTF